MTGWAAPPTPPEPQDAPVGWNAPDETPGLGTAELLRRAWGLYRSAGWRLLKVAVVPTIVVGLLTIPSLVVGVTAIKAVATMFADVLKFGVDPVRTQAAFQAVQPRSEFAAFAAACGGASIAVQVIGWAALTTAALAFMDGRSMGVGAAFRVVGARRTGIILPAITVGVVLAGANAAAALVQPTVVSQPTAGEAAVGALTALLVTALTIGAVVLGLYWSLGLPAIVAEGLGLRRGLARGGELTRGIRVRLGLALIVGWFALGFTVSLVAGVLAVVVTLATGAVEIGGLVFTIVLLGGTCLWAPFLPSMLAIAYRDRITPDPVSPVTVP